MADNMFKDLIEYIEGETSFTINTDLFAGYFPKEKNVDGIAIIETPGDNIPYNATGEKDRIDFRIRVISRALDYMTARSNSYKIHDIFKIGYGLRFPVSLPVYIILVSTSIATPNFIGEDEKGRQLITANYLLKIATI